MMMDSDSPYKPNGDYLMSPYSWHSTTTQDLQQFTCNAPAYSYADYGPVVVKTEYDDCGGGVGVGVSVGGGGGGCVEGSSSSSPGLELQDTAEPKKGNLLIFIVFPPARVNVLPNIIIPCPVAGSIWGITVHTEDFGTTLTSR